MLVPLNIIWLPMPRQIRKIRYRLIICTKTLSFWDKITKIGPVDHEIIVLQAIIKKTIKKKEINATSAIKIYSTSGKFAGRAK